MSLLSLPPHLPHLTSCVDTESFEITPQPSVQAQEKHEDKQVKEAEAGQVNEDSMETDDAPAVCITLILARCSHSQEGLPLQVPGQQVAANANVEKDKGKDKQVEVGTA